MELYFVTGNAKKLQEAREILGDGLLSVKLDLPELQGSSEYIVSQKALMAVRDFKKPVFVDDVSFELSCLGGFPGPYIKQFLEINGIQGIYHITQKMGDSRVTIRCNIGYCEPNADPVTFTGAIEGNVIYPLVNNFNWFDGLIIPNGYDKTFAQMNSAEKNSISHRKLALDALRQYLTEKK